MKDDRKIILRIKNYCEFLYTLLEINCTNVYYILMYTKLYCILSTTYLLCLNDFYSVQCS